MGVDTSIKVRIFTAQQKDYQVVTVSEQDNSLGSLFYNTSVSYTSIVFDRHNELSPEENTLFDQQQDEEDELLSYGKIADAALYLPVMEKISRKLRKLKAEALERDLVEITAKDKPEEEKKKDRKIKISDYLDFEGSFCVLWGIIKTAATQGNKIQLIHEFY